MSAATRAGRAGGAARVTLSALAVLVSCRVAAGCAADPGDPPKGAAGDPASGDDGANATGTTSSGGGVAAESEGATTGADGEGVATGDDAATVATPVPEAGVANAADDGAAVTTRDAAVPDGAACLTSIPPSCPDCMTQNASDQPICKQYIQCFITNGCDPGTACGSNTGVCGVNTVGGGNAPYAAAVATYQCACP